MPFYALKVAAYHYDSCNTTMEKIKRAKATATIRFLLGAHIHHSVAASRWIVADATCAFNGRRRGSSPLRYKDNITLTKRLGTYQRASDFPFSIHDRQAKHLLLSQDTRRIRDRQKLPRTPHSHTLQSLNPRTVRTPTNSRSGNAHALVREWDRDGVTGQE